MISSELAAKLMKLIPRLASDHDNEVVGTVRAIQRVLKADGLDLHDLASEITAPPMDHGHNFHGSPFGFSYSPPKPKPVSKGIYGKDGFFRPWNQVVGEILERHETIPKRYGGKFLIKAQITLLERIFRGEVAAHLHEKMLKLIDSRLHTAWEAQESDRKKKAA